MAETASLKKILNVRESEKEDAQLAHHQSIISFEEVATKLYEMLKKKEDAQLSYENYIKDTVQINKIKEQISYIELLNTQIITLQNKVIKAREKMETKQVKLTDAHVEVKKFEKLIENREEEKEIIAQRLEQQAMDEISIQQFLNHNNR